MQHPQLKWAQRKDKVFIEIGLRDISDEKIDLQEERITFNGVSDNKKYAFDIELYAPIKTQESKWTKTGFHMLLVLQKKETNKPYWPRLIKSTAKNQYILIDWAKWVDEDDEEDEAEKGLGALDPSQMHGFKGYPGMNDHDQDDQEEGNIDDLEKPEEINEHNHKGGCCDHDYGAEHKHEAEQEIKQQKAEEKKDK